MDDKERETLEPCPFCGTQPVMLTAYEDDDFVRGYSIRCDACGIEISDEYKDEVTNNWNNRYSFPVVVEPTGWRYGRKDWKGDIWRHSDGPIVPTFENPDDWVLQPLYAHPEPAATNVRLETRPAFSEKWVRIFPSQLQWLVKAGHEVRAIKGPEPEAAPTPDLTDPNVVHANMLRGTIAKPTWEQIKHLYPEQAAAPTREEIARIIDPSTFAMSDHYARKGVVNIVQADNDKALAKADAILALKFAK